MLPELEQLKLRNAIQAQMILRLQSQNLQQQLEIVHEQGRHAEQRLQALITELGTAHPELKWDNQRGTFVEADAAAPAETRRPKTAKQTAEVPATPERTTTH